jgi:hypothetical protein
MSPGESDTCAKLIHPAIHARGRIEHLIRREETAGAIEVIGGKPRKRAIGRVDFALRVKVNPANQPVAVALIEAKAEACRRPTIWSRPNSKLPASGTEDNHFLRARPPCGRGHRHE